VRTARGPVCNGATIEAEDAAAAERTHRRVIDGGAPRGRRRAGRGGRRRALTDPENKEERDATKGDRDPAFAACHGHRF